MEMQMKDRAIPGTNQGLQVKEPSLSPRNDGTMQILDVKEEREDHKKQWMAWPSFSEMMDDYLKLTNQITQKTFSDEEVKQL